jgi:acyl-coenzyme A thioesterase PaaI-like protein
MYDWFWIRNPFRSIHAAALLNMGEATMGFAALYWAEQTKLRVIPTRLEIDFFKKARGTLRGVCNLPQMEIGEVTLQTDIYDQHGDLVSRVTGVWKISKTLTNKKLE